MDTLKDYSGKHEGKCFVLGTGPSLNDFLSYEGKEGITTIGVNNIGQSGFVPDYVVVVDPIGSFQNFKKENMHYSVPFFTPSPEGWDKVVKGPIVNYNFAGYNLSNFGEIFGSDYMNIGHTSTFCAVIAAAYLGFTEIGMIGVDMTRGHAYDKDDTKLHPLNRILDTVNGEFLKLNRVLRENGIEVFNLSEKSLITAFPKKSIKSFVNGDN